MQIAEVKSQEKQVVRLMSHLWDEFDQMVGLSLVGVRLTGTNLAWHRMGRWVCHTK